MFNFPVSCASVKRVCEVYRLPKVFINGDLLIAFIFAVFFIIQVIMFYYLYIIVFIIFIQGNVDTKLNKELGADKDVVWRVDGEYGSVFH